MNKAVVIIVGLVLLLLIGGGVWFTQNSQKISNPQGSPSTQMSQSPAVTAPESTPTSMSESTGSSAQSQVKEFTVTGSSFKFDPATITVNKGDKVKIVFKNSGGNHDWVLDEFNAKTKVIGSGATDTVEFTADKAGSFEYYCSVGNHRQMGMKGTLIVQ